MDLEQEIVSVLAAAAQGKGDSPTFLFAIQILHRLPEATRTALIDQYGEGGAGSGNSFSAVSRVAQVAGRVASTRYVDTRNVFIRVDGRDVQPGYEISQIYCHRPAGPDSN